MPVPRGLVAALIVAGLAACVVAEQEVTAAQAEATLTPAEAQAKIEKYKREAENAVLDKVMTKREKVDGEMRKELKARKKWEEKDSRAVDRIAQEKKDFRKSGIMKKVVGLQNEKRQLGKQTKSLERKMTRTTRKVKATEARLAIRKSKEEIAQVEFATRAYEQWKAKQEARAAREISKMQKEAQKFKVKAAEQQARAEGFLLKIKKVKAQFKVREAGELRSKKEMVKLKERSVKIRKGLVKAKSGLEAEQLKAKIQALLAKEKANFSPPTSTAAKGAEDGLKKADAMLTMVKGEVSSALSSATREAVQNAKALAKAEKMKLEGHAGKGGKNKKQTAVNPNKKCGPGVLCTVYEAVVKKAGGNKKYFKLEAEELLKLKKANYALPNDKQEGPDAMALKAFKILGRRFGVTEAKPPCMKGPDKAIPCERYDNTVKETGGAAKFEKAYAKALHKFKKQAKVQPGAKVPKNVKVAAFDHVADFAGLAKGVNKPTKVTPSAAKAAAPKAKKAAPTTAKENKKAKEPKDSKKAKKASVGAKGKGAQLGA